MIAGERDLNRAAAALASRLPEPLGVLARLAYNYRWAWDPGRARGLPRRRPRPLGAGRREPGAAAAGGRRPSALRARRPTTRAARARRGARGARERRPRRARAATARRRRAPDRVLLRRVRLPRLAADLLRRPRRARRRHPQGGLRPRAAAGRRRPAVPPAATSASASTPRGWQHEYWVDTDPDRLPAALVTGDDGEPITITVPIGDDGGRRADLARRRRPRPALPARRRAARERRRSAAGSPRACTIGDRGHAPRAVHAARHRRRRARSRRWASSPASCTSTRATRRSPRSSSRAREYSGGARFDAALEVAPQAHGLHHAHAGPGRQRHLPAPTRSRDALGAIAGTLGVDAEEIIRLGRTQPRRRGRAVRRHPVRAAHEPRRQRRQPPPRRGRARDVARRCGPTSAVDDVPITHVTNGVHIPTWLGAADAASCSTATSARTGCDRATDPATWAPVDDIPAEELWDVRSAAARRADRVRAPPRRGRPPRARRAARSTPRPPRARSTRTC